MSAMGWRVRCRRVDDIDGDNRIDESDDVGIVVVWVVFIVQSE